MGYVSSQEGNPETMICSGTPRKINSSNLKNDGLKDVSPFPGGAFSGSMLIFPGVVFSFGVYVFTSKGVFLGCLKIMRNKAMTDQWEDFLIFTNPWMVELYGKCIHPRNLT